MGKKSNPLHDVEFYDREKHVDVPRDIVRLSTSNSNPASFLLKIALETHNGAPLPAGDKIAWKATLVFGGEMWRLHDWKSSSWTLCGPQSKLELERELRRKLAAACRKVEKRLEKRGKRDVNKGDFAIGHQFSRLHSYYLHLRKDAEAMLVLSVGSEKPVEVSRGTMPTGGKFVAYEDVALNAYLARYRHADSAAAAAILMFFGLTEVLLDASFAFDLKRDIRYRDFRDMPWTERVRKVIDLGNRQAKQLYDSMVELRRRYRHVFAHAVPTLFVDCRETGFWIPHPVSELQESKMNPMWAFQPDEMRRTFSIFDDFMEFFKKSDRTWAATMYAKSGLLIPFDRTRIKGLLKYADTQDSFQQEIDRRVERQDMFTNGGL